MTGTQQGFAKWTNEWLSDTDITGSQKALSKTDDRKTAVCAQYLEKWKYSQKKQLKQIWGAGWEGMW